MVLQLEDCVDCLKVMMGTDHYNYCFLFDHSYGHNRQHLDGLSVIKMNKEFGGSQPKMSDTVMDSDDFFGPYHSGNSELQVGSIQSMVFAETDCGLFYLSEQETLLRKFDRTTGKKLKKN